MKTGSNRILAYVLATTITDSDLDNVTGGHIEASYRQTVQATGSGAQSIDVVYDVSTDF